MIGNFARAMAEQRMANQAPGQRRAMRGLFMVLLFLGCAVQPRAGRKYTDVPIVVPVAAGTAGAAAGAATPAVVTVAVGAVVVGAEQLPDPPAGTAPVETASKDPNPCKSCRCFGKGKSPDPQNPREAPGGSGHVDHTRASCQQLCKDKHYTGFDRSSDKKVTWFN
jgi:hypothetical protein